MNKKLIKLFLRFAISIGFLSAVADRFGLWSKEVSVLGKLEQFFGIYSTDKSLDPRFCDSNNWNYRNCCRNNFCDFLNQRI